MLRIQKASAGSGKTFALTRKYISMLLGDVNAEGHPRLYTPADYGFLKPKPHGRILALTFTNKATQEMTTRIINELALLAGDRRLQSQHLDYLTSLYRTDADSIGAGAKRALADLLFTFSWFNVSTIDSFFQNVLHIFTRELDLPESFNLEISEVYPVAVAIGKILGSINLPRTAMDAATRSRVVRLSSWIQSFMENLIDRGTNANLLTRSSRLNSDLIYTLSKLRGETYRRHSREIKEYLSDPERITRFAGGLQRSLDGLRDAVKVTAAAFLDMEEAQYVGKNLLENYLTRWASGDFTYSPLEGGRSTLQSAIADESKRHKKLPKGAQWSEAVDDAMVRMLKLGLDYFTNERFYKTLSQQIYLLGLFSETEQAIEEYCRENDTFLLSDTNSLLSKVIVEVEAPFVYERIGYIINHFLIDEFQDTSEMQWKNLYPLVLESMSRRRDNLIIGDEKQCIYRFRNSNPRLLGSQVENEITRRFGSEQVEVTGTSVEDNTNWRSSRNVVMFNNTLFTALAREVDTGMDRPLASQTYCGIVQQVAEKNRDKAGYVKMVFGPTPEAVCVDDAGEELPAERWTENDQLRALGLEISRQLSAGYRPRDIAILVRSHEKGKLIIDYLLELMRSEEWSHGHVEIISDDALTVSSSPSVQLVIGLLRLMTTPQYVMAKRRSGMERVMNPTFLRNRLIHRYELCLFDEVQAAGPDGTPLTNPDGAPKMRRLTPSEALEKALKACAAQPGDANEDPLQMEIDSNREESRQNESPSLFAVTERLIRDFVPEASKREEVTFLSAFQDLVVDFEERGEADVESFLKWWDTRGHNINLPAPEGMNALSVMTVHQAKGLEYECVHYPFCDFALERFDGIEWYRLDREGFPGIKPEDVPPRLPLNNRTYYSEIPMLRQQVQESQQAEAIDTLNVAYVAFTRAVSELIVYADPAKRGRSMGKTLLTAIESVDEVAIDGFGLDPDRREWVMPLAPGLSVLPSGVTEFVLGAPTKARKPAAAGASADVSADTSADVPAETSADAPVNVPADAPAEMPAENQRGTKFPEGTLEYSIGSRPESFDAEIDYEEILSAYRTNRPAKMFLPADAEEVGAFNIADERHLGNFLHEVLANVATVADLPIAMERAAYRRSLPRQVWLPYLNRLQEALADERVRPWFEDYETLMNERPLTASRLNGDVELRRPDRVVIMPTGETVVIDYKFGAYAPKYHTQVRDYMALLAQCGLRNLRGYLYFPLTGKLHPVE